MTIVFDTLAKIGFFFVMIMGIVRFGLRIPGSG